MRVKPLERTEAMALLSRYQVQADLQGNEASCSRNFSIAFPLSWSWPELTSKPTSTATNNYLDLFRSEFWSPERAKVPVVPSDLEAVCRISS